MQELFGRAVRLGVRASAIALSALILASCGAGSDEVATPPLFSTTVVFGASLTDTGNVCPAAANCPPSPPYASGRYSDGTLFIETVAGRYGAALVPSLRGGNNFAYAGARTGAIPGLTTQSTTPSMVQQVDQFLTRQASLGTLSNRALFVVDATTFGNNIATVLNTPGLNGTAVVTQGVTDIVTLITRLYSAGARHILVVNSVNIGLTPLAQAGGPAAVAGATQLSAGFNQGLAGAIAQQAPTWPGLNLYQFDAFTLHNQITAQPANFGLTNVTQPCVAGTTICATPGTFLYWDPFHPTQAAGAIFATRINTLLPSPQ